MARRITALCAGWATIAASITLLIRTGAGLAPYDALNVGAAGTLGTLPGTALWITGTALVAAGWALGQPPGPGTPAGIITIGALINLLMQTIPPIPDRLTAPTIILAVPALLAGVALVVASELGAGPTEILMLGLQRQGMSLGYARATVEAVSVTGAYALGGPIGPLTIGMMIAAGPIIARMLPHARRLVAPSR